MDGETPLQARQCGELLSENKGANYPPIEFQEGQELVIFGVGEHAINPIQ